MADLGVDDMPTVVVTLYPSRESLHRAVASIGVSVPSIASGLVTAENAIHIISPQVASVWTYDAGILGIVHEFAHCVTLRRNPDLPFSARWLWEAVALFEARQFVDPRTVPSLVAGRPPPLRQLNTITDPTIYSVGGLMGAFIHDTWGRDTLIRLIRANGNILQSPAVTESEFLELWMRYLRERFGL